MTDAKYMILITSLMEVSRGGCKKNEDRKASEQKLNSLASFMVKA
jgi:hypothetical protein